MISLLSPADVRAQMLLLLPERLLLSPPDALAAHDHRDRLLGTFSRFVELLAASFFRLPFSEPNVSWPSCPRAIDAIRSS